MKFAAEGADVVVVDQHIDTAKRVAETIQRRGRKNLAYRADVTSWEQVQSMATEAMQTFGHMDILVNNAGISPKRNGRRIPIHEMDPAQWNEVLAI
ncbi:MAG TPA: SDR family oxidoreductase, partial [Acidimicrobiales bacterium]|nr:SDR family oxidoreductase [Acidimicrobiales bacterium]